MYNVIEVTLMIGYKFHPEYLFDEELNQHQVLLHENVTIQLCDPV
jgi:hypothetical protein